MNGDKDDKKFGNFEVGDTGVKFQEYRAPRSYYPETPKIIQWVIKYSGGLIKDKKQASYVLIGFVIVAIIVFLVVVFGGGSKIPLPPPTPLEERNF